ncbi:MAG TPA: adenosylcobinamide-GDP ribazoletransferase [Baekduia sp.]|jgi:adenosylcobinamide-GDP ribazoletransferase
MTVVVGARLAVGFLTVVPAGRIEDGAVGEAWLSRAAGWFPVVGALVGGVAAGVVALADTVVDPAVAGVLGLVGAIVLTRGLHEDGLADTADGLGVHGSRERRLAAMKDSAVGAHGALAMSAALLLAAVALAGLDASHAARALVAAHVLARLAMVLAAAVLGNARAAGGVVAGAAAVPGGVAASADAALAGVAAGGLGRSLAVGAGAATVATALSVVGVLAVCGLADGALALGVAAVAFAAALAVQVRAFGGRTGDTLGATGKLVEVATLVALAGAWSS